MELLCGGRRLVAPGLLLRRQHGALQLRPCPAQVGVSAKEGLQQARAVARDVASSRSTAEAGTKLLHHARRAAESPWVKALARLLICLYFVNTGAWLLQGGGVAATAQC